MRSWVKGILGLGISSSVVGAGFLIKHSLSTTDKTSASEAPKRVVAHNLFEEKFKGKKMIAKDDWSSWIKKVQKHKNQSYWPSALAILTNQSVSDSSLAAVLQSTCFNIDNGHGAIKDDVLLKKNFSPSEESHESVDLEDVVSKLCEVE